MIIFNNHNEFTGLRYTAVPQNVYYVRDEPIDKRRKFLETGDDTLEFIRVEYEDEKDELIDSALWNKWSEMK